MSTELDTTTRDTVARLAALEAQRADIDREITELKTKLAGDLTEGGYTINGKPVLNISVGRRFDPGLAAEVLPAELVALCQATVIDAKRAKDVLPPAIYAQCQRPNDKPTIRVR